MRNIWFQCALVASISLLGACGGSDSGSVTLTGDTTVTPLTCIHGNGLDIPAAGKLYHGVFPGDDESIDAAAEDEITFSTLQSYESSVGHKAAWVYFSYNWYKNRIFPATTAQWIKAHGAIPFIRLMLRNSDEQDIAEPLFTLDNIISGAFDDDLKAWGKAAVEYKSPLIVEWGTEMNGNWFSWNAEWNGGAVIGTEKFISAYRHIFTTICAEGASNITWVFHLNGQDVPEASWNSFENYYPGDSYVDWIGLSVYGAQGPTDDEWPIFRDIMDIFYPRMTTMAPEKPVFVMEFGVTKGNQLGDPAVWANDALSDLIGGRWPNVKGFSWWNEAWQNDSNPANDTTLRVQDMPGVAQVFNTQLSNPSVLTSPMTTQ